MGVSVPPGPPQSPTAGTGNWWWAPDAVIAACGVALVAIGVFGHTDTALLETAGIGLLTGAAGHILGKQSPTP